MYSLYTTLSVVSRTFKEVFMFNTKLKEIRQSRGLTQRQMAEILSMATNAYQRYELGTSEPNMLKLLKLSAILDVSLDELLCRDEFLAEHADEY